MPSLVDRRVCKDAGQYCADRTAYAMDAEGVKRVVITQFRLQKGNCKERDNTGRDADNDCAGNVYETGSRGDRNQSSHCA